MFESLKSKLSDTIGKISDKISAEEEGETSQTSQGAEIDSKKQKDKESKTKKVDENSIKTESDTTKSIETQKKISESTTESTEKISKPEDEKMAYSPLYAKKPYLRKIWMIYCCTWKCHY